jgi:tRNA G18 (ribose-2'-O)-methylase SpoU
MAESGGRGRTSGPEITSARSPRVRAARQLARRALRQRARAFLAEGPQAVGEALKSGATITELFVTVTALARYGELAAEAASRGAAASSRASVTSTKGHTASSPCGVTV